MQDDDGLRVQHLLQALNGHHATPDAEGARAVTLPTTKPAVVAATAVSPARAQWGRNTLLANMDRAAVSQRARWEIDRLPRVALEPAATLGAPRREGDYLLWRDDAANRVYFALVVPRLMDVMVTIRREAVDGTIKITGGSVTLTVSVYDRVGPQAAHALQDRWRAVMDKAPVLTRPGGPVVDRGPRAVSTAVLPVYVPLSLRGLTASIDTDAALLAGAVSVTASPDVGVVTYVIPLSELGAQAWKDSLDARRGDLIAGVCRATARYYATTGSNLTAAPVELVAPLGALLAGRGPEVMQVLDAQVTVDARVIVSGHPTVDLVTVDWRPSEGHPPESLVFGPDGGAFDGLITSQNLQAVGIDWSAQVRFAPASWPVVRRQGRLSFAGGDWTLLLKPSSWVAECALFVVLLDASGAPIPQGANEGDPSARVQCEVRFSAAFLEGGAAIVTTFEATSQSLTRVAYPAPPGEAPGEVKLTVFAQRGSAATVKARVIQPTETFLLVTVYASAAVEITVNAPEGGDSLAGELLALAASLA